MRLVVFVPYWLFDMTDLSLLVRFGRDPNQRCFPVLSSVVLI
jgi:hypothetical protein